MLFLSQYDQRTWNAAKQNMNNQNVQLTSTDAMAVMYISSVHNLLLSSQSSQLFQIHILPMTVHTSDSIVSTVLIMAIVNTIQELIFLKFARKQQPNPQVTAYTNDRIPCTIRYNGILLSRLSHSSPYLMPAVSYS